MVGPSGHRGRCVYENTFLTASEDVAVQLFDIGTGSALAVLLFILLIALALLKARIVGQRIHYEA